MHVLLSMLSVTDLCLAFVTLPTVLGVFWYGSIEVPVNICFIQMFLIHFFSVMESSVLLAMAFDRFVAICNPLRYSTILTNSLIVKIGFVIVVRGLVILLPIPILLQKTILCRSKVLSHAFCLHPDVMRLVCSRLTANTAYSLFAVLSTMGLDALLVVLSYTLILKAVCSLRSMSERSKAFHTCACHVCVVLLFYTPMIGLSMIHRFGGHLPTFIGVAMAYLHFLLPPALNPILYGIKTKKIYQRICQKIQKMAELGQNRS
ncbi:olfactory receptor 51G1-like [Discoglossus pictus]